MAIRAPDGANNMYIFGIQFDLMQKVTENTGTIKVAELPMPFGLPSSENTKNLP